LLRVLAMPELDNVCRGYGDAVINPHKSAWDPDCILNGAFVTEKTFKPIKHGQLFFVGGGAGSLQVLRDLGYRVFDGILDNSYDKIANHTQRWESLRDSIAAAQPRLPQLFEAARADIEHNQQLFVANKSKRLNSLIEKIHEQYR